MYNSVIAHKAAYVYERNKKKQKKNRCKQPAYSARRFGPTQFVRPDSRPLNVLFQQEQSAYLVTALASIQDL